MLNFRQIKLTLLGLKGKATIQGHVIRQITPKKTKKIINIKAHR